MPHRGRLNLLTDLLQYPPSALLHKIHGKSEIPPELGVSGDVISHLGRLLRLLNFLYILSCQKVSSPTLQYGKPSKNLKISMLPNPSHLGTRSIPFLNLHSILTSEFQRLLIRLQWEKRVPNNSRF